MTKLKLAVYSSVFLLAMIAGFVLFQGRSGMQFSNAAELDWRELGELDYITGKASELLEKENGKLVRIPGFMVPLEDNQRVVTQFLLVPTPQACIHTPPPPPNQMVLVEMKEGSRTKVEYGPIWIYGTFHLKSKRHMYGETSFTMDGIQVEPYR